MLYNCVYISFENTDIENVLGSNNLIIIMFSTKYWNNFIIQNVKTFSKYIMHVFFSSFLWNNSIVSDFYPVFLFSTYGNLKISNIVFQNSKETFGIFELTAISLEQNNTFSIFNSSFLFLKNNLYGPVKYIYIYIYK